MICYSTNLYTILIKDNGCGLIASIINHLNLIAITIVLQALRFCRLWSKQRSSNGNKNR